MSVDAVAAALEARLPHAVTRDVPVAELTTYRVGGPLAVLVRARHEDDLIALAEVLASERASVLVVGRGSNLLVADRGFRGVGVLLEGEFLDLVLDPAGAIVHAGGAVPLPVLARQAAAAGVGGLEFLVGIPGSVGGAVRMNAGGHGRETREVLERAWVLDLGDGAAAHTDERTPDTLDLSYRHSNVGPTMIVTRADLAGALDDPGDCEARLKEIVQWRREHQPGGSNAGSVFSNPPGDSAGRLIDAAGLKGMRVGGAVVSRKHANFFQAEPGATADDVARLVETVQARVEETTGIHLVPELRMIGFDPVEVTQ